MSYVTTIKVTFGGEVKDQDEAEFQANHCLVALLENPINANQIQNAEVLETGEE